MRILFDTNVLISAFVFKGFSAKVYDHCALLHEMLTSYWILDELREKLMYKFNFSEAEVNVVLELITERTETFTPVNALPDILSDKDDNNVLRAAEFAKVDYLITGDKELLNLQSFGNFKIISPRAFHDMFLT